MKLGFRILLACLAIHGLQAATITFDTVLTGAFEVPPNASPGTGVATVTIDDTADTVWVNLTYSGLTSPATNAHIHCCAPPGVNAPVVLPFVPAGFMTGLTSGTFTATFMGVDPTTIAGLEAGLGYINVHTGNFPGGELRANIVPEPASMALFGLGAAGLVFARRYSRRKAMMGSMRVARHAGTAPAASATNATAATTTL